VASRVEHAEAPARSNGVVFTAAMTEDDLLDGLRALADPNRLRIIELLGQDELYAQEIVGRLGIAQSAVSRHLALLERAGLVLVQPRRGMKYYRIAGDRLTAVADAVRARLPA
jgi:DNA-binding transcriptional ArsR family regulator